MKYFYVFFLIFFFYFNSIAQKNNNVSITGPERFFVLRYSNEFDESKFLKFEYDVEVKKRSTIHFKTDRPLFFSGVYVFSSGQGVMFDFFVFPGDSVKIDISEEKGFTISGKNSAEYELLNEFNQEGVSITGGKDGQYNLINDFEIGFIQRKEAFSKRNHILNKYVSLIRPEYYKLLKEFIFLQFFKSISMPYNKCNKDLSFIPKQNPQIYIDSLSQFPEFMVKVDTMHYLALASCLTLSLDQYTNFLIRNVTEEDKRFEAGFKAIEDKLSGKGKDLALTLMFLDKINNDTIIHTYMDTYKEYCKSPEFIKKLESKYVSRTNLESNRELLSTLLEDKNGKQVKWEELISANKGRVIYFDFWASWCGGCKLSLEHVKNLKILYPELSVIFISIDDNRAKWQNSMYSWNFGEGATHFLLNPESKLAQILAKPSIPRYSLINKDGHFVSITADAPNSVRLTKLLDVLFAQ